MLIILKESRIFGKLRFRLSQVTQHSNYFLIPSSQSHCSARINKQFMGDLKMVNELRKEKNSTAK